ncbi:MAG: hypothetical protein ACYCW6_23625 [Candidatus Xenobia bacterium]
MQPRRSGLTIVEMMFALCVLFVAASAMATVIVSSSHQLQHIQERATALRLVQMKGYDLLRDGSGDQLSGVPSGFSVSPNYFWTFQSPFPTAEVTNWVVSCQMPSGNQAEMEMLTRNIGREGIVATEGITPGYVAFGTWMYSHCVVVYSEASKSGVVSPTMPIRGNPGPPDFCGPGSPGALICTPDFATLWVCDIGYGGSYEFASPTAGISSWGSPTNPSGLSATSMAPVPYNASPSGGTFWLPTNAGHAIGSGTLADTNASTAMLPIPPAAYLGDAGPMATSPTTGAVWVGDLENLCLRTYTPGSSTWDPLQYKVPFSATGPRMGAARSISFASDGSMYVIDLKNLWHFTGFSGGVLNGTNIPLPADMVPSGMYVKQSTNTVYICGTSTNDWQDHLWSAPAGSGSFTLLGTWQ